MTRSQVTREITPVFLTISGHPAVTVHINLLDGEVEVRSGSHLSVATGSHLFSLRLLRVC